MTPRASPLRDAWRLRTAFGRQAAKAKLALLGQLAATDLSNPREVLELHELLCFWRAYPDGPRLLGPVERMLAGFGRRRDLRRHAARLENSGIVGTETRF